MDEGKKPEEQTGEQAEIEKEEKIEEKVEEKEEKVEESKIEEKPIMEEAKEIKKVEEIKKPEPKPEPKKEKKPEPKPEPKKERKKRIRLSGSEWYDKNYKKLLFISLAVLVFSIIYIGVFYVQHGDIILRDVTLTGGSVITVYTDEAVNIPELKNFLEGNLEETVAVRKLEDITTRRQIAVIVETKAEATQLKDALEEFLGYELDNDNSSTEISSTSLSRIFYRQLLIALVIAFVFMTIVVFIIFRTAIPSLAIILAAITDIIGALAIANLCGFHISTAGIAAFLMLIGYSVDTDIMLTTKVIRRRGERPLNSRIKSAARTGLTMTITSLAAVIAAFIFAQSAVLKQIFFILSAGLFIDLISTWFGNASIIKWYCEKKNIT